MTSTHIIRDGAVVNTIIASVQEAQAVYPDAICIPADTGAIGWLWDGDTLTPPPAPVVPLAELKAAKNAEINAARLAANFSTFTHAGKQIACDTSPFRLWENTPKPPNFHSSGAV